MGSSLGALEGAPSDHESVMHSREQPRTYWSGRMIFQPLYDMMLNEQPDLPD